MSWKELADIVRSRKTYIQTHNFPDADAIASAYGLQHLLSSEGIIAKLCYVGKIDKLNTAQMVKLLEIDMVVMTDEKDVVEEDNIIIVDAQKYNANIRDCVGNEIACIDHHPILFDPKYEYLDIRPDVGACSSIIAEYFFKDAIEMPVNVATALLYGIKMDTQDLSRGVSDLDIDMYYYLFKRADRNLIKKMHINTMEFADLNSYAQAIESIQVFDYVGLSRIDGFCPDALIASISDFILSLKEIDISIVYNVRQDGIKFSIRSEIESCDAGKIIQKALEGYGSGGGHASMAGGFIPGNPMKDDLDIVIRDQFLKQITKNETQTQI